MVNKVKRQARIDRNL